MPNLKIEELNYMNNPSADNQKNTPAKKRRVLIKLSGEALAKGGQQGFNDQGILDVARQVKNALTEEIEIGIVIGGGNFWRGRNTDAIDRTKADQIGMLATVMNCLYVSEMFRSTGIGTEIVTPFSCGTMSKVFSKDLVNEAFAEGKVVFFAGGIGHPYFSTDTTIALRAIELEADEILLAKSIDGVYDKDPAAHTDAVKYETISIQEVLDKQLKVVDLTATVMCMEQQMPMVVFGMDEEDAIEKALKGNCTGTIVTV